jgi:hypothetical protein
MPQTSAHNSNGKNKKTLLIVSVVIFVVILIIAIIVAVVCMMKKKEPEPEPYANTRRPVKTPEGLNTYLVTNKGFVTSELQIVNDITQAWPLFIDGDYLQTATALYVGGNLDLFEVKVKFDPVLTLNYLKIVDPEVEYVTKCTYMVDPEIKQPMKVLDANGEECYEITSEEESFIATKFLTYDTFVNKYKENDIAVSELKFGKLLDDMSIFKLVEFYNGNKIVFIPTQDVYESSTTNLLDADIAIYKKVFRIKLSNAEYNEDNYIYYSPILNKQARDVDMIPFDNQVFKTTKRVETLTIENIVDENGLMYFTDYLLRGKIENNQILIKIQTSTGTEFVEPNSSFVANNDIISHATD